MVVPTATGTWFSSTLPVGSRVCDYSGSGTELVVIDVLDLIQVPFNPNSVYALHLDVVYGGRRDTSHWADVGSAADFDFRVLDSEIRPDDWSGIVQIRVNGNPTDNTRIRAENYFSVIRRMIPERPILRFIFGVLITTKIHEIMRRRFGNGVMKHSQYSLCGIHFPPGPCNFALCEIRKDHGKNRAEFPHRHQPQMNSLR